MSAAKDQRAAHKETNANRSPSFAAKAQCRLASKSEVSAERIESIESALGYNRCRSFAFAHIRGLAFANATSEAEGKNDRADCN